MRGADHMPTIFVPREVKQGETRVAASPETVQRLTKDGFSVVVETAAGARARFTDAAFEKAGATITRSAADAHAAADVIVKLHPPIDTEIEAMKEGALLVAHVWPFSDKALCEQLMARKLTVFAMDQIPRTTKAQYMDALSSQMNLAGYKAVIMAAEHLPKAVPLMMTAAGTVNPAKFVIMGAGVAGLSAIGTAKRLGAAVEATDVRPETKEQVQSLGAKFIEPPGAAVGEGGYAAEQSADFLQKQKETVRKHLVAADVIVTTAKIPGRKAPVLVTEDVVRDMKPGAVIVDLAAEEGGNCELTVSDEIVERHGVTIIGTANIPATLPVDASALYAKNILNVIKQLFPKEAKLALDFADPINDGAVIFHAGACRSAKIAEAHGFPAPAK
jgi:H+-translocating NAD(P) transhydrogenase subunit alpha